MRRSTPTAPFVLCAIALLGAATLGSGCFSVDEPICAYKCGTGNICPDDYSCMADGYCHKNGTTGACDYSDAAMAPADLGVGDMSDTDAIEVDMTPGPDGAPAPNDGGPDDM
jgi:hypothetical protein